MGSTYNVTVDNCIFKNNHNLDSAGYGGAISAMDAGYFHLYYSTFINNTATTGKAIAVREGEYIDDNHTWDENITLGNPVFGIAYNTFVDVEAHSNDVNIAYVSNNASYIAAHNNTFYTPSEYANLGNQQSNIFTNELLGLSIDDVELVGDSQDTPQWAMDGFDSSNSMESPYSGISDGAIVWNTTYENLINGFVIDKDGRIIVIKENENKIYFVNSDGTENKTITVVLNQQSVDTGIYPKNISISPDNNLYIPSYVNTGFTTDEKQDIARIATTYESDIYRITTSSSGFFPAGVLFLAPCYVEIESVIYPVYYYTETYGGITIGKEGDYDMLYSEGYMCIDSAVISGTKIWVPSDNGLNLHDINNYGQWHDLTLLKTITGVIGRPVADADGNVYFFTSDSISKADSTSGVTKTQAVTGGTGSRMAISSVNNALYSVNSIGTLYKYSLDDLTESEVYDIGTPASTIMTDANGVIYVGTTDGKFYAISDAGEELWSVDTESGSEIKNCAMDNEGNIYFYTAENKVYAINEAPVILKNVSIEVTVPEGDYKAFDNVTVTATLNESVEGTVTFTLGDLTQSVAVNGTTAVWTTVLKGGNQTIFATFEGNDDYAKVTGNVTVSADKLDVEFEKVPEELSISIGERPSFYFDIVCNGINVTTGTLKGYEGENSLSGTFRYYSSGWRCRITTSLSAGVHEITLAYSGDDNYNAANKTFTIIVIPQVSASAAVDYDDNKINVDVTVSAADASGKFTVVLNNETLAEGTIENGTGSASFDKLEPGEYEITVAYVDDGYYGAINATTSFKVIDKGTSQWSVPGFDNKNSGNPDYVRFDGILILWNATVNNPASSAVIDEEGNIYIADNSNIKIFSSNGTLIATKDSGSKGALSLFDDYMLIYVRPWTNIAGFDITDGFKSVYADYPITWFTNTDLAPIMGDDGRIYLSVHASNGAYPNEGKYLTMVGIDEINNNFQYLNVLINYQTVTSPVIDDAGILWVTTTGGLFAVDTSSDSVILSNPDLGIVGRPVIDDSNIVYTFGKDNTIYALNAEGVIWNVTVNNGIGSVMAIDNENALLYAVDANGTLFSYNTEENGASKEIYNIRANATSIIVDANGAVFIADAKGNVWAFDSEGNQLWNISLNAPITAPMAMNKNGVLYVATADTIYALGYPIELSVEAQNLTVFDEEKIVVNISEGASGNVIITVNGVEYESPIENGAATLDLGKLPAGIYNVTVTYAGSDSYYPASAECVFEIIKEDAEIEYEVVSDIDESTITLTLPEDATGYVLADVNGAGYYAPVKDGNAIILIPNLKSGNYTAEVTYLGDDNYNNASIEVAINVPEEPVIEPLDPELEVSVDGTVVTVSLDELAGGYVVVSVDDLALFFEYGGDPIVVDLADYLEPGNYTVDVTYSGDEFFAEANATADLTVPEVEPLDPELDVTVNGTVVTVSLNEMASGYVVVGIVDDMNQFFEYDGEPIDVDFDGLQPGDYTVKVFYSGDEYFAQANATASVSIPQVDPLDPGLEVTVDGTEVTVSLDEDASGYVVVSVDGKDLFFEYEGDPIVVDLSDLEPGTYTVDVAYSGDEEFAEANTTVSVSIPEVEPLDPELEVDIQNTTITVSINENATGLVIITVGDISFVMDAGELDSVDVSEFLTNGTYPVTVEYLGDDVFDGAVFLGGNITVPEEPVVEPLDPGLEVDIQNTTIAVSLNENATGLVIITVGDISFVMDAGELDSVDVSEFLTNGTYPVTVEYLGDDVFDGAEFIGGSVTVPAEPVVEPKDPNFDVSVTNNTITATVDKDATGNVLVDVDGQGYYAPVKDGKAVINVIGLDEGKYQAIVSYVGDDVFAPANTTVSITVPKKEDPTPEPVDPKANISISEDGVDIALPEDATGYLLVDVDGTGYYAPVKDGKASLDLPELAPGNHTVTVTYTGDKKYDSANATKTVEVEGPVETIISENLTKVEKSPDRFEATFTDAQGNALANTDVKFVISGNTYTRTTDANGKAGMNINLPAGNYSVTVINPVTNESKVNTITVLPRLEGNDLTKYFKNASQFYVKVFDDNGNPVKAGEVVTFNINGVFYNRTTDDNGMAKLSINLIDGDYVITSEYKGCKIANNIKVLPILTAKDLTKQYGKSGAFEATLVDGQGKPYANQQVEFNINGVFYKRTTGSNGVAKLNINLQAGKYIVTSSFNGYSIANTVTVTA